MQHQGRRSHCPRPRSSRRYPIRSLNETYTSPGIATVRPRTSRISQIVTLVAVVVPPIGILCAMGLLWGVAFDWVDLALFAGFYVVCAFGTTIGFHRYFTHRGFETSKPVEAVLAILGCM